MLAADHWNWTLWWEIETAVMVAIAILFVIKTLLKR